MELISPDDDLRREQEAEWKALPLMHSTNFKQILETANIAPEVVIQHPGAETITLKGGQISDKRAWKKFLASANQPIAPRQLIDVGEKLAVQYKQWILTSFTKRYQVIQAEADLSWIEQVVSMAVKRFILLNKYEAFLRQQPGAFTNPLVAIAMLLLMKYHELGEETPRLIHHIVKDPNLLNTLLEVYFEGYQQTLRQIWPLIYEPRAPLPQGMIAPADQKIREREQQQAWEGKQER